MMQIPMDQFTRQGINAVREGRYGTGRQFLAQALKLNPRNALAWLWLAACTTDRAKQRECLLRVLAIEPNHPFALRDLAALDGKPVGPLPGITPDPAALPSLAARPLKPVQAAVTRTARDGAAPVAAATTSVFTGVAAAAAARQSSRFTAPLPSASPSTAAVAPASSHTASADVPSNRQDEAARNVSMTADDAVAIAAHRQSIEAVGEAPGVQEEQATAQQANGAKQPAGGQDKRRRPSLLIPALLIASLLIGMFARHVTGSPSRVTVDSPASTARRTETTPAPAMPEVPSDVIASAGTGFLDGSSLQPMADASPAQVPLWHEPFTDGGAAACAMPHDTAVLVLNERIAADGSRSVLVQHRECVGWIAETFLSPDRLDETPVTANDLVVNTSK